MKSFLLGLWQRMRGTPGSPLKTALAVALGLFIGCQPLYGLHLVLVLAICLPFKLDSLLAYLAANVSNPLVAPFLLAAEVQVGALLTTGELTSLELGQVRRLGPLGLISQLAIGSIAVGAALSLLGFALALLLLRLRGAKSASPPSALEAALTRTRARYAGAPRADDYYVAGKLALDPVFRLVAEVEGDFGRVLDVGCGRGQLGVFLLELGRAHALQGLDSDARKIEVARRAAPEGEFRVANAAHGALPAADTILLVDVLHYLEQAEQDALLRGAARALSPGGRLLVRELDARPGARSVVTRAFEWIARRIGVNRGSSSHYRPAREIQALLEQAGLSCNVQGASERTPFGNVLIVAAGSSGSPAKSLAGSVSAPSTLPSAAKA